MQAVKFLEKLINIGICNYYGVPDSQLKALCNLLYEKYGTNGRHTIAPNEGSAVALAAGHHLATGECAMVYMQNSGIGNAVNPITSLLADKVYGIPVLFVIGWRGQPGIKDEPQHMFQGQITLDLLQTLKIKTFVLKEDSTEKEFDEFLIEADKNIKNGKSCAIVVSKGALSHNFSVTYTNGIELSREEAIEIITRIAGKNDVFVSTTGKASRELFEIRERYKEKHSQDFLTVGSMGHASMIAYAIAKQKPNKKVWCIDGDGAMMMHLGNSLLCGMGTSRNLVHIVINNGAHETVGGMPTAAKDADFVKVAKAFGYDHYMSANDEQSLNECTLKAIQFSGSVFIEVKTSVLSRKDLGRPTLPPKENKKDLMDFLQEKK